MGPTGPMGIPNIISSLLNGITTYRLKANKEGYDHPAYAVIWYRFAYIYNLMLWYNVSQSI